MPKGTTVSLLGVLGGVACALLFATAVKGGGAPERSIAQSDQCYEKCKIDCQTAVRLFTAGQVIRFIKIIDLLRSNEVDQAIELMEDQELGLTLAHLMMRDETVDLRGDRGITFAIRRAREYRDRYPRVHPDAAVQKKIDLVLAQLEDTSDEAEPDAQAWPICLTCIHEDGESAAPANRP